MDRPTDEEIKSKLLSFEEMRKKVAPIAKGEIPPVQRSVRTEEQKVIDLQLDVSRLITSIVDLDRVMESQSHMIGLLVRAITYMDSKLREGKY